MVCEITFFPINICHLFQSALLQPVDKQSVSQDQVVANVDQTEESNDPTVVFSETINSATKLLYDLDIHVQQFVPNEGSVVAEEIGTQPTTVQESQTSEPQIYSAINSELDLSLNKQGESVGALVTQLDTLQKRIQVCLTKCHSKNLHKHIGIYTCIEHKPIY